MTPVSPTNRANLNDLKVDSLSTKNNNMKQRRVVNAAAAKNPNDYVIKSQVDNIQTNLNSQIANLSKNHIKLNSSIRNLINYGTHVHRLIFPMDKLTDGSLYFEIDRGNVGYQLQNNRWFYISGIMVAANSGQAPPDLGTNDIGFMFFDTGLTPPQLFVWSGIIWIP